MSYPAFVIFLPLWLILPGVRIDGGVRRRAWWLRPLRIPVRPGRRTVVVTLFSIYGGHQEELVVDVAPGSTVLLDYRAPATAAGVGQLMVRDDPELDWPDADASVDSAS